jgi:hypothetical protein
VMASPICSSPDAAGREPANEPKHELVSEVNAMLLNDVLIVATTARMFLAGVYIRADLKESRRLMASLPLRREFGNKQMSILKGLGFHDVLFAG